MAPALVCVLLTACSLQPSTPLQEAAASNDPAAIERLLNAGGDVNEIGAHGLTPICTAARCGAIDSIRTLASHGADLNLGAGVNSWTPLMHSIHKRRIESVRALLDAGASTEVRGPQMGTPLMMAAGYGYTDIVNMLLDRGADPRAQLEDGSNALSFAILGVPDIDRFTATDCQSGTVRALLARAPELRLPHSRLASLKLKVCRGLLPPR